MTLVTSYGLMLPPETPEEIVLLWNDALQNAMATEDVQAAYAERNFIVEQTAEEADQYLQHQEALQAAMESMASGR